METGFGSPLPDFGPVIKRRNLLRVFVGHRFGLTLVCAPAGYGKSVLASQLVEVGGFDQVAWVSGLDEDMQGDGALCCLAHALASSHGQDGCPTTTGAEALLAIRAELKERATSRLCLVLDGCNSLGGLRSLLDLSALLRRLTSADSALIVTCRVLDSAEGPLDPTAVWIVEDQELRFTTDEVLALQVMLGHGPEQDSLATQLAQRFGGHPALTSLLLRHVGLDDEVSPPRDLVWYVDRLVSSLSPGALELLYVASLLQDDEFSALAACGEEWPDASILREMSSVAPLLHIATAMHWQDQRFRVHAVARDSGRRIAPVVLGAEALRRARSRVLNYLWAIGDFTRMQAVLRFECEQDEIVNWCQTCGQMILRFVGPGPMLQVLAGIESSTLAGNPSLLLLRALTFRARELYEEARTAALLASSLAEAEGDHALWVKSLLLVARLAQDVGRLDRAREALGVLRRAPVEWLDNAAECLIDAQMALVESNIGEIHRAVIRSHEVVGLLQAAGDLGSDESVFALNCASSVESLCSGGWATAARIMASLAGRDDLSPMQQVLVRANLSWCQLELGLVREASELLDEVIEATESAGLQHIAAHAYETRSCVRYAMGDAAGGLSDYEQCRRLLGVTGNGFAEVMALLNAAANRRAAGQREEALAPAEEAALLIRSDAPESLLLRSLIQLEIAASHLSMGDVWAARRTAITVRGSLVDSGADAYMLHSDLVLAETDRLSGEPPLAARRLLAYDEHIASGSANWLIALYIRAFPGLLGVLAKAIGAENIPLRMLLMIPPETLELGIGMAGDYLSEQDASILRHRRGAEGAETHEPEVAPASAVSAHTCYARLFGGLEVTTEAGVVDEASWRKRKARLLFVILALRQHQDIPREVLLERLWPDMDEEHAKRNFYVTWSTMKRALACGGSPAIAKPLVQCSGGVCRATRLVRSDLDEFDEALANLRRAAASGDPGVAIASARLLVDIYRGELLPGDLYEEWLTDTRERAKHDFCDAMMLAASLAETTGDFEAALLFLRKASAADPWREDVYQATMRCQMNSGQRSRAIETYLSCRSRLTEDLGIDPSTETTKLYQAVLAMEDGTAED